MQLLTTNTVDKAESVGEGNDPLFLLCFSPCSSHPVSSWLLAPAAWGWRGAVPFLLHVRNSCHL